MFPWSNIKEDKSELGTSPLNSEDKRDLAYEYLSSHEYECIPATTGRSDRVTLPPFVEELFSKFERVTRRHRNYELVLDRSLVKVNKGLGLTRIGRFTGTQRVNEDLGPLVFEVFVRPPDETVIVMGDKPLRKALGEDVGSRHATIHHFLLTYYEADYF